MDTHACDLQAIEPRHIEALLTADETARVLDIDPMTLAAWRHQRRALPFVKIGRMVRYRQSDVRAFIDANVREAA
ncbi:MAG TPA: helix-turn-helix domain-containing protein [Burkholderiaceae bacterium]